MCAPLTLVAAVLVYWWWDTGSPPVRDFRVSTQIPVSTGEESAFILVGTLDKIRDCQFLGLSALLSDGRAVPVSFSQPADAYTFIRPPGPQNWGPWRIWVDDGQGIEMYARFTCNGVWSFTVRLGGFVAGAR
ncbi:hypothetical protein [Ottowia sp.]|uniref:hypothetical protein n=1 Tax=Ottowia sp. TaxID=1898956 RepID=UPI003A8C72ED